MIEMVTGLWPGLFALADTATAAAPVPAAPLWSAASLVSLATLAALEIVLGIDNVIFIAILSSRLPKDQQPRARRLGISMAVISRLALLLGISWVMGLTRPLFNLMGQGISGKQLILLLGGLFLIGKATFEIHDKLEGEEEQAHGGGRAGATLGGVIAQIMLIDIVFSLDSVITAVGMTPHVQIMMVAVVLAAAVMLVFAGPISSFVQKHPTMKMLALAFLILIGVMLVAEAFGQHVDKGYIYFAMAFSLLVELLNMRLRKKSAPVVLHHSSMPNQS
ncbi:TerC family protein [Luteitalea sp.]|uniref:TerC family protein n=1 Tax=Luteitalea sp. TaxID=2004800 RepID=UPI0037C61EEF